MQKITPSIAVAVHARHKASPVGLTLLLFRLGNFYETFGEDAVTLHRITGATLCRSTIDGKPVDVAGIPMFHISTYLHRIEASGQSVAVYDGMTLPQIKQAVDRGTLVYWRSIDCPVRKDQTTGEYVIGDEKYSIGLTHQDGVTLNGRPEEFAVVA